MNNCQTSVVRLVIKRLRPVKVPIKRPTFLGPYRSEAQPPRIVTKEQISIYTEKILEVAPRLTPKSASRDFRNMPKE